MLVGARLVTVFPALRTITGNGHDMTGAYLVRPLAYGQIPQAFPLVSLLDVALTMGQWQDYAGALIERNGCQSGARVAGAPEASGAFPGRHPHALDPERAGAHLRRIRILAETRPAPRACHGDRELRGRRCHRHAARGPGPARRPGGPGPGAGLQLHRRQPAQSDDPAASARRAGGYGGLFKATGFQGDYMRRRKCFTEPG